MIDALNLKQKEYVTIANKNYQYLLVSKSYLEAMELKPVDIIGKKISDIWKDVVVQNQIVDNINQALSGNEVVFRGKFTFNKDKMWYRVKYSPLVEKDDSIEKVVISTTNITNEIKAIKDIIKETKKDKLTGVYSRSAFEDDIKQTINKETSGYVLMFFDLDNFKSINDKFGHVSGDLALTKSSKIFRQNINHKGKVYRIGGDEFLTIVKHTKRETLEKIATKIIKELKEAEFNKNFNLGVSIGILQVRSGSNISIENQLKMVDENMYTSKKHGKNGFTFLEI
ncbi:hypothetical protein CO058_00770 [candidate division WWE3 bacterium CG_4_9_14_0_2_um_filter_35_11]|uniref:GGDEF domain-containing protein n=1 Tax=candidate division WWE3 bacterium CG_4_9_14_0_2_um_filter_35_11 TaxID=1975077 RepID=A0A2M8EMG8_UNCKA|nr:MAG: hypothetical protein COV25_02110 [candidate division WWE3 bacterium CG10_big_fil_rev_8_21_14_0_10_35_32]PJC23934.1 MAG: hypothetical protein CO058_00770 [candidate division WWE3 bacterium CG_4_9_14_0_2_um_filter_35_11]